jgi:hypothetical protein
MMEFFLRLLNVQPFLPTIHRNQKRLQQCAIVYESIIGQTHLWVIPLGTSDFDFLRPIEF